MATRRHNTPQRHSRSSMGFTLMEVLGAVAVLAIIATISIAGVLSVRQGLQMTQLDSTAQQIYLSVQNRLSALRSAGTLTVGSGSISDLVTDQGVSVEPADYAYDNAADVSICAIGSDAAATSNHLLTDEASSITSKLPGSWVIELSPYSGEVYSVFYSETLSSSDLMDKAEGYATRSRAERQGDLVGYYAGGKVSVPGNVKGDPFNDLAISVVNGEELYVRFLSEGFNTLYGDNTKMGKVTITLTVEALKSDNSPSGSKWTKTFKGSDLIDNWAAGANEFDVLLDSMALDSSGNPLSFKNVINSSTGNAGSNNILAGRNIKVSAKLKYSSYPTHNPGVGNDGSDGTLNSTFNSFDGVNKTITVANVRHLNNLRDSLSDYDNNYVNYTTVKQVASIDFGTLAADGTTRVWPATDAAGNGTLSAQHMTGTEAHNPLSFFTPISLQAGFNAGTASSFTVDKQPATNADGTPNPLADQLYTISNFTIGDAANPTDDTGLFKEVNVNVNGLSLVDTTVSGKDRTGAIAGTLGNGGVTVENCSVTSSVATGATTPNYDAHLVSGNNNVGGLFGEVKGGTIKKSTAETSVQGISNAGGMVGAITAATTMTDCGTHASVEGAAGNVIPAISGQSTLGGLIGTTAAAATVSNCFAAVNVHSTDTVYDSEEYFGGVVGVNDGGQFSKCYASGEVIAANNAGGFAGQLKSGAIADSYTTSNVWGSSWSGGFIGGYVDGSVTNDVSLGQIRKADGSVPTTGDTTVGAFAGSDAGNATAFNTCRFMQGVNYNDVYNLFNPTTSANDVNVAGGGVVPTTYPDLINGVTFAGTSHPYSSDLTSSGLSFPFAGTTASDNTPLDHWGNWPRMDLLSWSWTGPNGSTTINSSYLHGTTPDPNSTLFDQRLYALSGKSGNVFNLFSSWNTTTSGTTVSFTPNSIPAPIASDILFNDAITGSSTAGSFSANGYTCQTLWKYVNGKVDANRKSKTNFSADGEAAPGPSFANAAYGLRIALTQAGYDMSDVGFRIYVRTGTYAHTALVATNDALLGTTGGTNYADNFTVSFGDRPIGGRTTCNVITFDLGRYMNGLPAYKLRTCGVTTSTYANFVDASDWFAL